MSSPKRHLNKHVFATYSRALKEAPPKFKYLALAILIGNLLIKVTVNAGVYPRC